MDTTIIAENLKRAYKRKNPTEQKVMSAIIDNFADKGLNVMYGKNAPNLDVYIRLKNPTLIIEAYNPNLTDKGNNRRTEFCLIYNGEMYWFDAKQGKRDTNIKHAIIGHALTEAVNCDGNFFYVLEGEMYSKEYERIADRQINAYADSVFVINVDSINETLESL